MDSHEKKILVSAGANHFLAHYCETLFPALTLYVAADMNLPVRDVITIGFPLYLLYGILALPWGYVGDVWDSGKAMGLGMALAGIGAISAGLTHSPFLLTMTLALVGVGISSFHPCGISLVSKGIAERGRAMAINGAWGTVGLMLAPFIAAFGGFYFGWRMVFVASGVFALAAGVLTFFLKTHTDRHTEKHLARPDADNRNMLYFVIVCVALVFGGLVYRGNIVTMPKHFQDHAGAVTSILDKLQWGKGNLLGSRHGDVRALGVTLLMSIVLLVSVVGQYFGGWVADKFDLRYGYIALYLLALPPLIGMIFLSGWWLAVSTAVFLMFTLGSQPVENSLIAMLTPTRLRSTAYGIKFTLTFGVGSVAAWIAGRALGYWHTSAAVYSLLAGVLVLLITTQAVLIFLSRHETMRHDIAPVMDD